MKLHHIAIGARDVEGVARFYREVFELPEDRRHHYDDGRIRSVWLRMGTSVLMIEETPDAPRARVDGVGAGPFLLAFAVSGAERAGLESRLERAGAPIDDRTGYTSYARDPEGNRVAISCYPLEDDPNAV